MFQLLLIKGKHYSIRDLDSRTRYMSSRYLQEAIEHYTRKRVTWTLPNAAIILATADSPYEFNVTNFPEFFI
jgi:hypothetical protein